MTHSDTRIRIGGSARSPTQNIEKVSDSWVEPAVSQAVTALAAGDLSGSASGSSGKFSRNETKQQPRFGKFIIFIKTCLWSSLCEK